MLLRFVKLSCLGFLCVVRLLCEYSIHVLGGKVYDTTGCVSSGTLNSTHSVLLK